MSSEAQEARRQADRAAAAEAAVKKLEEEKRKMMEELEREKLERKKERRESLAREERLKYEKQNMMTEVQQRDAELQRKEQEVKQRDEELQRTAQEAKRQYELLKQMEQENAHLKEENRRFSVMSQRPVASPCSSPDGSMRGRLNSSMEFALSPPQSGKSASQFRATSASAVMSYPAVLTIIEEPSSIPVMRELATRATSAATPRDNAEEPPPGIVTEKKRLFEQRAQTPLRGGTVSTRELRQESKVPAIPRTNVVASASSSSTARDGPRPKICLGMERPF